jgi:impB/mucB/samB family
MPAVRAERLCPAAIFVAPDFTRYRAVSKSVREIFQRHTDLIEPLSLDEAYLDVTQNKTGLPTATLVARTIREQIRQELNLTALGWGRVQQVPGEACFGLAQTGWALCHPARGNRCLSRATGR